MPIGFARASIALLACTFTLQAAAAEDPIVGAWVGTIAQSDQDPEEARLTFVSPKGGISRYGQCGGMLVGGRKGDNYAYQETITWGGVDERQGGCIGGLVQLSIDGKTMKYQWTGNYEGQDIVAAGELHREKR
jgi:hypothetical protein